MFSGPPGWWTLMAFMGLLLVRRGRSGRGQRRA
ncbi:MAG: GlyGly-CTERM sorting domain-containing protein, partial [Dehalococcoidia bacterium]|nr:GlyGly-CTERM sorting domain-containing protein [Dehalococcoidia bacterium]